MGIPIRDVVTGGSTGSRGDALSPSVVRQSHTGSTLLASKPSIGGSDLHGEVPKCRSSGR